MKATPYLTLRLAALLLLAGFTLPQAWGQSFPPPSTPVPRRPVPPTVVTPAPTPEFSFKDGLEKHPDPNCVTVAKALQRVIDDPREEHLIDNLENRNLDRLCKAYDLIAPADLASMFGSGVSLSRLNSANLSNRFDQVHAGSSGFTASAFTLDGQGMAGATGPEGKGGKGVTPPVPENRWGVFITGFGEFVDVGDTGAARGYDLTTGGFTLGGDYRVLPKWVVGLTLGYANTGGNLGGGGSLDVNGGKVGVYTTVFTGGFYVNAAVNAGLNSYDSRRAALGGNANSSTDGHEWDALVGTGYDFKMGKLTFGPTAGYEYTHVSFDGFREHGSLAPLAFNNQNTDSARSAVGARASYEMRVGHVVLRPEVSASWQHEFDDRGYALVSRFASGAGGSFSVLGAQFGRDSLLVGAGVTAQLSERTTVYLAYDGDVARTNYQSHNVTGGVRVSF